MMSADVLLLGVVLLGASTVLAQASQAPANMNELGPWSRKVTNEQRLKSELNAFFKEEDEAAAKRDMKAMTEKLDFPIYMVTDDRSGNTESKEYSKEQFFAKMMPFYEVLPKDRVTSHNLSFVFLSDSIAQVTDDLTVTAGQQKYSAKITSLLVKKNGQWKRKVIAEPGWGGVPPKGTGGSGPTQK